MRFYLRLYLVKPGIWADMNRLLTSKDRRAVIKPCLGQENCLARSPVRQGLRDFRRA